MQVSEAHIAAIIHHVQSQLDDALASSKDVELLDVDAVTASVVKEIAGVALNYDCEHAFPPALLRLSRAHMLVAEELDALARDVAGSVYAGAIPYLDRTQLGTTLGTLMFGCDARQHKLGLWDTATRVLHMLPASYDDVDRGQVVDVHDGVGGNYRESWVG